MNALHVISAWVQRQKIVLMTVASEFRPDYLPPAMIYFAAGVSGLTAIVGTFFVKGYLGLSAAFLASLGFWAGIPWALKMPLGHLVDLFWRWKGLLVFLGAGMIAGNLAIMVGLIGHTAWMHQFMSIESWYIIAALLAPVGYVLQDVVADAMTVEAVPEFDMNGKKRSDEDIQDSHQIMQTIARGAAVSGSIMVALLNVFVFRDIDSMAGSELVTAYLHVYQAAFAIPFLSILGVLLAGFFKWNRTRTLKKAGAVIPKEERPVVSPNWIILGGSLLYVVSVVTLGMQSWQFKQEIVFAVSFVIVSTLLVQVSAHFDAAQKRVFFSIAAVIFLFRAMPGPGPGVTWWEIDVLGFDQQFLAHLMLIANLISLTGLGLYAVFFSKRSILFIYGFLAVVGLVMSTPIIGMYFGLHEWTAEVTNGLVTARTIALVDTAMESPLGQVAMIPLLAWVAWSAPKDMKATFFAVVTSFTNLGGAASNLCTKYLNAAFVVKRQVLDPVSGVVLEVADYSELGTLMIICTVIGFLVPIIGIFIASRVIGDAESP